MNDTILPDFVVPEHILQPLLTSANCSTLDNALEILTKNARNECGRSELASKNIVLVVLDLIKLLSTPLNGCFLLSSLKLLRNLCAGEFRNQTSFLTNNGIKIISIALESVGFGSDSDIGIVRTGLQLLGNVSLAGEEHQRTLWLWFFPDRFVEVARMRRLEISDPLCMVIYTCCGGSSDRIEELCGFQGLRIVAEIIRTASLVGFGEEWLKWLLSKVCFETEHFPTLFYQLSSEGFVTGDETNSGVAIFSEDQAFMLDVLSESSSQQRDGVSFSNEFAMCVFGILKKALEIVNFFSRGQSSLPTGNIPVDVLGYSITILRDVCAHYGQRSSSSEGSIDVVDSLISFGILELLLSIVRDLEPPEILRKTVPQGEYEDTSRPHDRKKKCPYKGFRRDIVALIGNCVYKRKHAQDEIRRRDGIIVLLQQCGINDDDPFLREWGIRLGRSLFEGNQDNQRVLAEMELLGTVDDPELLKLGLQVAVDEKTQRPKLVNATHVR